MTTNPDTTTILHQEELECEYNLRVLEARLHVWSNDGLTNSEELEYLKWDIVNARASYLRAAKNLHDHLLDHFSDWTIS